MREFSIPSHSLLFSECHLKKTHSHQAFSLEKETFLLDRKLGKAWEIVCLISYIYYTPLFRCSGCFQGGGREGWKLKLVHITIRKICKKKIQTYFILSECLTAAAVLCSSKSTLFLHSPPTHTGHIQSSSIFSISLQLLILYDEICVYFFLLFLLT